MKNKKLIIVVLLAILFAYSFSNLFSKYQEKYFLNDLSKNNINHIVSYDVKEPISTKELLNVYDDIASNENIVLYSFIYKGDNKYINYYNPSKISEFNYLINNYKSTCSLNCIEFQEIQINDFSLGISSIQFFSTTKIDKSIFDKYNLNVSYVDEYDVNHEIEEDSSIQRLLNEYNLFIIINILICITLIFILFTSIIKNIYEINLYGVYGYRFKTLFSDLNKKYLKINLIVYFSFSIFFSLIFYRNFSIFTSVLLFLIIQAIIVYIIFTLFLFSFYNNIKKDFKYKYIRKSIVIMSLVVSVMSVLTIQFMKSSLIYTSTYLKAEESYKISKNYYSLDQDMSMDIEMQKNISNTLINDYNAIYRVLMIDDEYVLEVEESFFKSNMIKDIDGNEVKVIQNTAYVTKNSNNEINSKFKWGYDSFDLVYLQDKDEEYITLDNEIPNVKLSDAIIIVKSSNEMLISNVSISSSSKENVEKIFNEVYEKYNIKYKPKYHKIGNAFLKEEFNDKSISSIFSVIIAFIALLITNISYTYLIFENNKDKILLSNIYGHRYINRMSFVLKEFFTSILITFTLLILLGIYSYVIFGIIIIVEFIILNIITVNLVNKNLINNIKEEL